MTEAAPAAPERQEGRGRRIRRFVLELAVLAGVYLVITSWQERHLVRLDEPAPNFALMSLDGRRVSLDSFRGKRLLVHFWATWCGVCRREFGTLNAVNRKLAGDEALVSVVADSDDPDAVRRFVAEHGIEYPVLLATDEALRAFHVDTFPTNYYVDPTGIVRSHTIGMSTRVAVSSRLGCAKH